ncbi:MAG: type II/IV secretion system ATPase subunit [Lachnospiraceae bacterium]|nr:type II/IV secretion system ATPase subunit [Lachnospiraceae bacterium]
MEISDFQRQYLLKRQDYGVLYPYVVSEQVTDINWNGRQLWIDDLKKGRYMAPEVLSGDFVERFISLMANVSGVTFNRMHPVLEIETEELRISIVHSCVAASGAAISLRKIPALRRLDKGEMVLQGYCSEEICNFLLHCIQAHCSIAICGLPGAGKTELLKYLTKFIPASERVITIEDVLEIHYRKINPNKDCVEMKVAENFTYTDAIKASLRQLPQWIILSEARSVEVRYLLESLSTGTYGLTTLHTDDVRNIPDRMKNMAGGNVDLNRIENDVYRFLDVGILIRNDMSEEGQNKRYVEQIALFDRSGKEWRKMENRITMLVEDGKVVTRKPGGNIQKKFEKAGIRELFGADALEWRAE